MNPWRFTVDGKAFEIAVDGPVVANDGAVLVDAAVDGLGLAYVFESMVRQLVSQRRLVACSTSTVRRFPGTSCITRAA